MPISDFIQNILNAGQYLGENVAPLMGNNWQQNSLELQRMKQQQAQFDAQQAASEAPQQMSPYQQAEVDFRNKELARQQQQAESNFDLNLNKQGFRRSILPLATDGLTQTGAGAPSLGAGGGNTQPTGTPGPIGGIPQPQLGANSSMQGVPSQTPNAANSGNAGLAASRFSAPTASAGGEIFPAKPIIPPIPTVFTIIGPSGKPVQVEPIPGGGEPMIPIDPSVRKYAPADQMPLSQYKEWASALRDQGVQIPGTKPTKEEPVGEDQRNSAIVATANAHGLDPTKFSAIHDLPVEYQEEAWAKQRGYNKTQADKDIEAARLVDQQAKNAEAALEPDRDKALRHAILHDPQAAFENVDKKQFDRVRAQMETDGEQMPTRALDADQKKQIQAADVGSGYLNDMRKIAQQLGPGAFNKMLVGKLKNNLGEWGSSAFSDPAMGRLEAKFRDDAQRLTGMEVKQFGGGRASVILFNTFKNITPSQGMDMPTIQGAFDAAQQQVKQTKASVRRYQFGLADNPEADYANGGGHYPGEVVSSKGIKYRIKSVDPDTGHYRSTPVGQ